MLTEAIRVITRSFFWTQESLSDERGRAQEQYTVPFGKAVVRREGKDVTIVAYSMMVLKALEAAEELAKEKIECEVIDLRSILPLDYETVLNSLAKTNRIVVCQEANLRGGLAGDIVAEIVSTEALICSILTGQGWWFECSNALQHGAGEPCHPEQGEHQAGSL